MKNQDKDFEVLLSNLFESQQIKVPEEDFVDRLMTSLPKQKKRSWFRLIALFLSGIISLYLIYIFNVDIIDSAFLNEVLNPILFDNYTSVFIVILIITTLYGLFRISEPDLSY